MAESTLDLRGIPLAEAYPELSNQAAYILEGIDDPVAGMSTIVALIHHAFAHLWTGFYRVAEPQKMLRIGPYQGTVGCLEIPFGKGVCGIAAAEGRTVIVDDVSLFPGHITCDARSRSEIVVPVFDRSGHLTAVLDIDSDQIGAFGDEDRAGLENMMKWFGGIS